MDNERKIPIKIHLNENPSILFEKYPATANMRILNVKNILVETEYKILEK